MSKKSRRRNRRILKALGAGLALAGLGGAFTKNTRGSRNADTVKAMTSDAAYKIPKAPKVNENEFKEVIVTTPNTMKDSQVLGRMRGSGDEGGFTGQNKRAAYAQRMRNIQADKNRNDMLRAIRSTQDIYTSPDSILQGVPESALMAKKGGRIVKGKKTAVRTGAAKRGFGRAFKGGK
tara:strand:+ start:65 stop:598 length:534 start_codon:yes stop_codon:yes gene_type:complete